MGILVQLLLPLFVTLLSFLGFFHPISTLNEDLGRHLLLGRLILYTHHVPLTNLLSYTYPQYPFTNSHWLAEVIFAGVFLIAGSLGLVLLMTLLGITLFLLLFVYIFKRFSLLPSIFVFLITLLLFYQRLEVRPQVFSYFLTSIFLVILFLNREKPTKWLFVLIPLELLWVNLHIYFLIGPLLVFLFLLKALQTKNQTKLLVITLLGTLIVTLFNPNFFKGAVLPFTFWQNYGLPTGENVSSLFALQHFVYPPVYLFFTQLSIITILLILYRKKTSLLDWLLVGIFSSIGFVAVRNLPLFALGVAIPFAKLLYLAQKQLFSKRMAQYHTIFSTFQTIIVIFFLISSILIFTKESFGYELIDDYKAGVDFFLRQNLHGPIFNNFDIGSYLDYRLYPKERVFVDNRPEAYPASFFQNTYLPMEKNSQVFYHIDKQDNFQTIIFGKTDTSPETHTFLLWLNNDSKWRKVYEDTFVVIFKRS